MGRCCNCSLSPRAFACLVTVAGSLFLASVVVPSTVPDGEYTKAACAYNLMQLGKAIRVFADDHGGYICELTGRVTRWRDGAMVLRREAGAALETEKHC